MRIAFFLSGALLSKLGDPVYFSFKKNVTFFSLRGLSTGTTNLI